MKKLFQLRKNFVLTGGVAFLLFTIIFAIGVYNRDSSNFETIGEHENIILAGFLTTKAQILNYLSFSKPKSFLKQTDVRQQVDGILKSYLTLIPF